MNDPNAIATYDLDEVLLDVTEDEVEPQPKRTRRMPTIQPTHPAIMVLRSVSAGIRSVPPKRWLLLLPVGILLIYIGKMQPQAKDQVLRDDRDMRNIPAFDESGLIQKDLAEINEQERNLTAFLNEERQRSVVAIAFGYRSIAAMYLSTPGHPCNGKSEAGCLASFSANRIAQLNQIGDGKIQVQQTGFNPNAVFEGVLKNSSERDRVEGLRLAKILAKPVNSRLQAEQDLIDNFYPILNAGLPVEELRPRPATFARLLQQNDELHQRLAAGTREATLQRERCLQLPPAQQKDGCK